MAKSREHPSHPVPGAKLLWPPLAALAQAWYGCSRLRVLQRVSKSPERLVPLPGWADVGTTSLPGPPFCSPLHRARRRFRASVDGANGLARAFVVLSGLELNACVRVPADDLHRLPPWYTRDTPEHPCMNLKASEVQPEWSANPTLAWRFVHPIST